MDKNGEALLRAVGDEFREQMANVRNELISKVRDKTTEFHNHVDNRLDPPEVHVTNQVDVPVVNVQMDMLPVADAIGRMGDLFARSIAKMAEAVENQGEMLAQLVRVVADSPAPTLEVHPVVNSAPAPQQKQRAKRSLLITHDDGTKSTVEEV